MTWEGELAKQIYKKAANRALLIAVEAELGEANKTVPIEEAILERSGEVSQDTLKQLANISYNTKYAKRQHEDRTLAHDPGRRAKWLERTLNEDARKVRSMMADEIRRQVP